jgi:U3 small nucleolar ribonucleoprotein protein IMP4
MAQNKPIPTELYKEENKIRKQLKNVDDVTIAPRTHIDDEYNLEYLKTPKLLVTTSRHPSARLL